jgi:hypothetical protein
MRRSIATVLLTLLVIVTPRLAFAGDGATIIMKSGVVVTITNGYNQLVAGMRSLKSTGVHNYPVEIEIENTSFYVNLGEVALLCRDTCSSMTISSPREDRRAQQPDTRKR